MEFPHLNDTNFPDLTNIDVWAYQNTFDYSRWQPDVMLKLCRVAWRQDYTHVIDFKSDEARDKYFDNLRGEVIELTADSRRMADTIKVPETYSVCSKYNYVCVQPKYPDPNIDYSDTPRRLYYFIDNIRWLSPNTTELELQLDVWTTYINSADITNVYLERGHAPMYQVDATAYLRDPLDNSENLLTPDVNFTNGSEVISKAEFKHYAGEKYVCLALPIAYSEFDTRVKAVTHTSYSAATFDDTDARYGYQYQVNNYTWTDTELNGANILTHPAINPGAAFVPSSARIYAVKASDLFTNNGWKTIQTNYPYLIDILQACFIVDEELITLGDTHVLSNITFYELSFAKVSAAYEFELTKSKFNYPERYSDIAKLYTYPYAWLELSNDVGGVAQIRIEDISGNKLVIDNFLHVALPFLNWNIAPRNVGANGRTAVNVKNLSGTNSAGYEYVSDFYKYLIDMGIPTYSILLSAEDNFKLRNAGNVAAQRNNALVTYHNTLRATNTGHANTVDSNATAVSNTAASNATSVTNTRNSGNTATNNTALAVATSTANTEAANNASTENTSLSNSMISLGGGADETLQNASIDINRDAMAASNTNNMIGGVASAIGGSMLSTAGAIGQAAIAGGGIGGAAAIGAEAGAIAGPAGMLAGAAIAGVATAAAGVIQSSFANQNSVISMNASADIAAATINNNRAHRGFNTAQAALITAMNTNTQSAITSNNNTLATNTNANNVSLANTNTGNAAATSNANAARSQTTSNANSQYARNAGVANAKDTLRAAQYAHQMNLDQSRVSQPIPNGVESGNPTADAYGRRVIGIRVKTQSKNAIRCAGDYFIRYGYAYNGIWNIDAWTSTNKRYTYWQCSDIVLNGSVTSGIRETLAAILANGVTVWADPEMKGGYYE